MRAKVLSMLLSVCMLVGVAMPVSAAEPKGTEESVTITEYYYFDGVKSDTVYSGGVTYKSGASNCKGIISSYDLADSSDYAFVKSECIADGKELFAKSKEDINGIQLLHNGSHKKYLSTLQNLWGNSQTCIYRFDLKDDDLYENYDDIVVNYYFESK